MFSLKGCDFDGTCEFLACFSWGYCVFGVVSGRNVVFSLKGCDFGVFLTK